MATRLTIDPPARVALVRALLEARSRADAWPAVLADLEVSLAVRQQTSPNLTTTLVVDPAPSQPDEMRPLTPKEAAAALDKSLSTVRRMMDRGDLEVVTVGRRRHVRASSIRELQS
jgi:excisionase family DNA binding protein